MAITKDIIWAAADTLDAEGHNPTLAAVRKAVGGGSYTTIQAAMTEWKERRAQRQTAPREAPPAVIAERLQELGSEIWAIAAEQAHLRLSTERETWAAECAKLEASRQEATDLADQLTAELEELRQRAQVLAVGNAELSATVADLRQELAGASARCSAAEAQIQDLRNALGQAQTDARKADALAGQVELLQGQVDALLTRLAAQR